MKKINLIFFFIILTSFAYSEDKVVYLDVNFLLTESEVGKYVNSNLKKVFRSLYIVKVDAASPERTGAPSLSLSSAGHEHGCCTRERAHLHLQTVHRSTH